MGAENFSTKAKGKTVSDAFRTAVDEAHYEYGHRGYTGSVCEKPSAVLIDLPKGVTAGEFIRWVEDYDYKPDSVPTEHVALVQRAYRIWQDKWGPAVAVKVAPGEFVFFGLASS